MIIDIPLHYIHEDAAKALRRLGVRIFKETKTKHTYPVAGADWFDSHSETVDEFWRVEQ